jgi:purine-binding chemotaxis protein CheW
MRSGATLACHRGGTVSAEETGLSLVCRVGERLCALPLAQVVETMRPMPVSPVAGAPSYVPGVAIIRGDPLPVVDVGAMLGSGGAAARRFVTLRVGSRQVALAVGDVVGVRALAPEALAALPPLLRDAAADALSSMGALDHELLLRLDGARVVPEAMWHEIELGRQTA